MTVDLLDHGRRAARRGPALIADGRPLGLRRQVVSTSSGRVVVHASAGAGGTALILLHGAAGSWTTWTPLLSAAQRSASPLTEVVAIDLPGWGESPVSPQGLDVDGLSRMICEVAYSLGYRRWILVGHSLGGFLALDIAAREPARTAGVLLVSPSGPAVIEAIRHPLRGWFTLPGFAGMLATMRVLARWGSIGRRLVRALDRAGALRMLSAPLFADPAHVHRSVVHALADEVRPRAFAGAARAAAGYDLTTWRRIECPVVALRGERDVFVADSDRIEFARLIRTFDQRTVPAAGHFAGVEQPEVVLDALRPLVAGSASRAAS